MEKSLIVAVADNWAIGRKNALLWSLPEDMKYFRRTTMGCPVIMGFMTFQSIGGRPLPGRKNIVISIFPWENPPQGITIVDSLEAAYKEAELVCNGEDGAPTRCFVMGGGYTYAEAMPLSDTLYITHVHDIVEDADTFFPVIDPEVWEIESRSDEKEDPVSGIRFNFTIYRKRRTDD